MTNVTFDPVECAKPEPNRLQHCSGLTTRLVSARTKLGRDEIVLQVGRREGEKETRAATRSQ